MAKNASAARRVCLVVIDGWGLSESAEGNAIRAAATPVMDELQARNSTPIAAHGLNVGLPDGLMGNSEVGHLNIGAGRVIYQDIVRINLSITKDTLKDNALVVELANRAKTTSNGRLHLAGLVSDGGVHSHIRHLEALLKAFKGHGVPNVYVHFFGDGRDTSPTSGVGHLEETIAFLRDNAAGQLATVVGRYYAMDRDKRWERIRVAYDALIGGVGEQSTVEDVANVVRTRYANGETDEFLKPIVLGGPEARIKNGDTVLFFNYRADRMRQIVECLGLERYKDLGSELTHPSDLRVAGMTEYKKEFNLPSLFPPQDNKNVLAEWLAHCQISQFHCAETEKYAHVTFFFNGGREAQFEGEERCMVASPKVATYDLKPEMSAAGVADKVIEQIESGHHPFVMCNFAPPDMVGHTGVYTAAVTACEATDTAIGRIRDAAEKHGYLLLVTADHGNAEKMTDDVGKPHTAHTCYPVPFTCSDRALKMDALPKDRPAALQDVAPTVLRLLGLPQPAEMGGQSLIDC